MALIPLIRLAALSVALAFSVLVLGISAGLTSTTEEFLGGYFVFAALAIATSALAMITLPVMIALEILRPGGFTSMILVEVSWLFILSVLFLATGADGAQAANDTFTFSCGDYIPKIAGACRQTGAIQAFSFLNWIILMTYSIFILVLTIIAGNRKGNGVWRNSVAEAPFFAPAETPAVPMQTAQHNTGPTTIGTSAGGTGPTSVQGGTISV